MKTGLTNEELAQIRSILKTVPAVEKAVLFGSRAMGLARSNSDVDIMLYGSGLKMLDIMQINRLLEETTLPYQFDFIRYDAKNPALHEHVKQYGKIIFEQGEVSTNDNVWQKVRLGDVCKFQNGFAFKSSSFLSSGKYRVIKIKELKDGEVRFFEDSVYLNNFSAHLKPFVVNNGDILFALTGDPVNKNNPLSWVGRVSRYAHDEIALLNQRVCKAIVDESSLDKNYMYYYFRLYDNFFSLAQKATGSANQANISTSTIGDTIIDLPSLNEQRKIADMLSSLDIKITLNKAINNHLEEMAKAIFKSWFVDFEPWGGVMPDDWRKGTISDLGDVIGGSTPSKAKSEYYTEHGIAWITPKDLSVKKSKFIYHGADDITELGLHNSSARLMPQGTILFSSRAPIGYIAIAGGEVCTNQGFKSVIPKDNVGTAFIYYFLYENLQIIESMASGSTFKEVSGSTMKGVPAVIPDDNTLCQFQENCIPIFEKQELLELENAHIAEIRDFLLPRLMSGELSVADLGKDKR